MLRERKGEREREREREREATTVLGLSLSPSLSPDVRDPCNAADLSCCLFLSSSSSSTAPCLKQQGEDKWINAISRNSYPANTFQLRE